MPVKFLPWGHLDKFSLTFNSFKRAVEAYGKPEELVPGYLETVRFFLSSLNEFDISFRTISVAREGKNLEISKDAYENALFRIRRALRYMNVSIDCATIMKGNWQRRELYTTLDKIGSEINWTELGKQIFAFVGKLEFDLDEYIERTWDQISKSVRTSSLSFIEHFEGLLHGCREALAEVESEIVEEMNSSKIDPIITWKKAALAAILGAVVGACLGSRCTGCILALSAGNFAIRLTCDWKSETKE